MGHQRAETTNLTDGNEDDAHFNRFFFVSNIIQFRLEKKRHNISI